jgi:hypothetical protein
VRIHPLLAVAVIWAATLAAWVATPSVAPPAPAPNHLSSDREAAPGLTPTVEAHGAFAPSVEGKILSLAASPDGERVAFLLQKGNDRHSLGLYDLKSERLLTEKPLSKSIDISIGEELTWSTDSRYVAPRTLPGVWLLDRDGRIRSLKLSRQDAEQVIWSPNRPGRFVYEVSVERTYELREHDVETGADRLLRKTVADPQELQIIQGSPCFTTQEPYSPQSGGRWISVRRIEDGTGVFRLWLPQETPGIDTPFDWDEVSLSLSPNARFFFLAMRSSGTTVDLLARTKDAGEVFRNPRIAAYYLEDLESGHFVRWAPNTGSWLALLFDSADLLDAVIDPETGIQHTKGFTTTHALDFLPNGDQVAVADQGLVLRPRSEYDLGWHAAEVLLPVRTPLAPE